MQPSLNLFALTIIHKNQVLPDFCVPAASLWVTRRARSHEDIEFGFPASLSDSKINKLDKRCRTCINNETTSFWSELDSCGIIKCDKDLLIGNPLLSAEYGKNPPITQQLFEPGKISAVFKFGNSRRCKICQVI